MAAAAGVALAGIGIPVVRWAKYLFEKKEQVFTASVPGYDRDMLGALLNGFRELGVTPEEIRGKRVLLKPNLVEPHTGAGQINTHPLFLRACIEAFLTLGAASVAVGEGPGHRRDTYHCLETTGVGDILQEDHIAFADFNFSPFRATPNPANRSTLGDLFLPDPLLAADLVVSVAKMKTHHLAGVTLTMKNLFGVMPGSVYGWPKNVLHHAGIINSILDINATVKPAFAIVDGIVGMEGDGPIMGTPVQSGLVVMGRNPAAVDSTCARLMGIDPLKIPYIAAASGWLGTAAERNIEQRGEAIAAHRRDFQLIDTIEAQQGIRL
ncbi:DUF362 domain-containing protein [Pseudodesulfovibrio cashew]|uniref:DUF362 domain-containing protein n=2 Tax=Pseudodesulfovibrio cashew TaxID=2678688 RepID=A0A6I6JLF3_9BACT|nr:DUF362 domain-containing protein [Pseudodesulfovibrio cashew]